MDGKIENYKIVKLIKVPEKSKIENYSLINSEIKHNFSLVPN